MFFRYEYIFFISNEEANNKLHWLIFYKTKLQTDAYYSGCYSLRCPGFLQTSSRIALEAAISRTSTYGGDQFGITIQIWKVRQYKFLLVTL